MFQGFLCTICLILSTVSLDDDDGDDDDGDDDGDDDDDDDVSRS